MAADRAAVKAKLRATTPTPDVDLEQAYQTALLEEIRDLLIQIRDKP